MPGKHGPPRRKVSTRKLSAATVTAATAATAGLLAAPAYATSGSATSYYAYNVCANIGQAFAAYPRKPKSIENFASALSVCTSANANLGYDRVWMHNQSHSYNYPGSVVGKGKIRSGPREVSYLSVVGKAKLRSASLNNHKHWFTADTFRWWSH